MGIAVGTSVGIAVGIAVGTSVGIAVGASVGTAVGIAVGASVGTAVGMGVGMTVGMGVGSKFFTHTQSSPLLSTWQWPTLHEVDELKQSLVLQRLLVHTQHVAPLSQVGVLEAVPELHVS